MIVDTKKILNTMTAIAIGLISMVIFATLLPQTLSSIAEAKLVLAVENLWYYGLQLIPQHFFYNITTIHFSIIPILGYSLAKLTGHLSLSTIRLATAFASALTLSFTYLIGALRSKVWGIVAVLFVLGSDIFVVTSRSFVIAPYMTALATIALFTVITIEFNSIIFYTLFTVFCMLGFLIQGVIGVFFVTIMTATYLVWLGQWQKFSYTLIIAVISCLIVFLCVMITSINQGGAYLGKQLLLGQINSLSPNYHHLWGINDWLDLLCYSASLPVAIITVIVRWPKLVWPKASWDIKLLRCLLIATLIILVMTIFLSKPLTFALPIVPLLALVAAHLLTYSQDEGMVNWLRKGVLSILVLVPFFSLAITITVALPYLIGHTSPPVPKHYYIDSIVLLGLFCLLTLFIRFRQTPGLLKSYDYISISFLALASYLIIIIAVSPIHKHYDHIKDVSQKLSTSLSKKPQNIIFYQMSRDQIDTMIIAYLNMKQSIHKILVSQTVMSVQHGDKLTSQKKPAYVVTTQKIYKELQKKSKITAKSLIVRQIGSEKMIIFDYQPSSKKDKKTVAGSISSESTPKKTSTTEQVSTTQEAIPSKKLLQL